MRLFLKHTIIFLAISIGLLLLLDFSICIIDEKYANFKLAAKPKYVVLGHSHPECAFNDSLITDFRNLCQSGESYFYTYFKLKQILKQNPSIKVVFVEFTNNQIDEKMDNWIWSNKHMSNRYPIYSSFMRISDKFVLLGHNPFGYINSFSLSVRRKLDRIFKNNFDYSNKIGGYLYLKRDKTASQIKNIIDNKMEEYQGSISEYNLSYLTSIITYCRKTDKTILLIRSPQHEKYLGYRNESDYQEILKKRYGNVEYIDFSKFPLSNSEFGDLAHLNYKGAKVFSEWFEYLLNQGLSTIQYKQPYIDNEIKARIHIKRNSQ